ncbi:MAG TPA: aminomethyltransferase beta-barrel domain-containing protein, partial [Burkholderiales bacterium]|nr:aminomethyltransferase beta-barrel domain-containing protein [Burkholderiales bacterium]
FYTIGQRKGIGLGGPGEAWYVAEKRVATNELVVVRGHDHPLLLKTSLCAQDASWVAGMPLAKRDYSAKTRYRQADAPCTLTVRDSSIQVDFASPQWAITPGQSVVLYDGEACLGGAVIT